MEFEDVSEEVEGEARRIAAAFGLKHIEKIRSQSPPTREGYGSYRGVCGKMVVAWRIESNQLHALQIEDIGKHPTQVDFLVRGVEWTLLREAFYGAYLVRGLYRLGIEEGAILSQLPELTAHEQLELRLSMPREFWPQRWLDEVG